MPLPVPVIFRLIASALALVIFGCAAARDAARSQEDRDLALEYLKEGGEHFDSSRFQKAIDAYQRAAAVMPDYAYTYFNMAVTYERLGLNDRAIENYHKAISLKKDDPVFHYSLGVVYGKEKQFGAALAAFTEAADLAPSLADSWYGVGWAHARMGRKEAANPCSATRS